MEKNVYSDDKARMDAQKMIEQKAGFEVPVSKDEMTDPKVLDYMQSSEFKSSIGSHELEFEPYTEFEKYFLARLTLNKINR